VSRPSLIFGAKSAEASIHLINEFMKCEVRNEPTCIGQQARKDLKGSFDSPMTNALLQKPYPPLMYFVSDAGCNGREQNGKRESGPDKMKIRQSRCVSWPGSTAGVAAQHDLRLNLTQAAMASCLSARSGALRTQAPPRTRRLHKIPGEFFQGFANAYKDEARS
jgi:hypothetical protein